MTKGTASTRRPVVAAALITFVVLSMVVAGCSIATSTDQITDITQSPPASTSVPASTPAPTPAAVVEPPATPTPQALTPTPVPEPTAEPDTSPVVIEGEGWAITENDYATYVEAVEEIHELEFTDPVGLLVSDDIGQDFARGFEPFPEDEWLLMRGLGLAASEAERLEVNQFRLDRIRGLCCRNTDEGPAVVVEPQSTKFATSLIVVHELVHALHNQYPNLEPDSITQDETPLPYLAAVEGVPQFVTFEYMRSGSPADQAQVAAELPIVPDFMLDLVQAGAARHLNFAYDTGPSFVDEVVAERGIAGLSELLQSPPTTTEQVLFPDKYLAGETATTVDRPPVPAGAQAVTRGTIGSAMLWFLLAEDRGAETARQMVEPWAGDSYVIYELNDSLCLAANIEIDTDVRALPFAELLTDAISDASLESVVEATVTTGGLIELQACHPS